MDERAAVSYFLDVLGDSVMTIKDLMIEIEDAPYPLAEHIQNEEDLEEFLNSHDRSFMVENGLVVAFDDDLEKGRQNAAIYFENELNFYNENPSYMNFRGHIGQADENVKDFIQTFYRGTEFRNFLLSHPDVFFLFEDDTVALIENISVDYFEDILENVYEEGPPPYFMNLRGHIGQAPTHVIDFINTNYPDEQFLEFLGINPEVFRVDRGYVFLNEENDD